MSYEPSPVAVAAFFVFVGITLGLSFLLGRRARSSAGYFAAHGEIPWLVNGVAFAGDYLSAASFLGICGMIAFYGYDGFLYSIGYLAGWIVALFVVAEPLKRLGRFTFADALDAKFQSRGIRVAAGMSTLAVSVFYLIPQMVGAGVLVRPLLGFPHWVGVVIVGATVIVIVATAGMVSTTWVQFLKGALLVVFSAVLTLMLLARGFEVRAGGEDGHEFRTVGPIVAEFDLQNLAASREFRAEVERQVGGTFIEMQGGWVGKPYVGVGDLKAKVASAWRIEPAGAGRVMLTETQIVTAKGDGTTLLNGGAGRLHPVGWVSRLPGGERRTGPLGPVEFLRTLHGSEVVLWGSERIAGPDGSTTTVYYQKPTPGSRVLRPGEHPEFQGIRSDQPLEKLNFISLMLALFCGTAALPHILIRYYTVKDEESARKSTIVGIATIGFFYVLTLYLGLGAMTSGTLDPTNSNMAAPLLARGMSEWLFAIISAIAFTTVLGTVSGLILASAGAVTHDLLAGGLGWEMTDHQVVRLARVVSVVVGALAIALGIVFQELNVSYLVGWAFSVAASANLPAIVMVLFWPGATKQGVVAGILVGMVSSLAWILLSADTFTKVYGLPAASALVPFSQPGIVTIPLGFLTSIGVSLATRGGASPTTRPG